MENAKSEILQAAEAELLRRGSAKLRVVDVAASLGMSHANIYRYFKTREALIDALVQRWLAESERRALASIEGEPEPEDALRALMAGMHAAKRERLAAGAGVLEIYASAMTRSAEAVAGHRDFIRQCAGDQIRRGIASGLFVLANSDVDTALDRLETLLARFIDPMAVSMSLSQDTQADLEGAMTLFVEALKTAPLAFR